MKFLNQKCSKTALGVLFSVIGAMGSMSAIASIGEDVLHEQRVEIIKSSGEDVNVYVDVDGKVSDLTLTHEQLTDETALRQALVELPDEVREQLIKSLSNLSTNGNVLRVHHSNDPQDQLHWKSSNGDEQVIVVEIDEHEVVDGVAHKVIKHFKGGEEQRVLKIQQKGMKANMLVQLIEKGEFTSDDLDKIQQALDAKR
ncbi:hypothetical protein [Thalassotalea sp. G2M2-11]|uniref:hypothetical protein n=1 Tax=Thalassotalea sp. G2M2-11 TaxID=2787627 RepID=UPI0019D2D816|nr:hypothetical protein [Thalassotalea sp. G2M2-11]